jgi:hypothetical protein
MMSTPNKSTKPSAQSPAFAMFVPPFVFVLDIMIAERQRRQCLWRVVKEPARQRGDGCARALRFLRGFGSAVCYACESRSHWFVLLFAGACALGSIYGFLQGAWPFGLVEAVWSVVALRRWVAVPKP